MSENKDFFVYELTPVKEEKPSTSRAAASNEGSVVGPSAETGTPSATIPSGTSGQDDPSRRFFESTGTVHYQPADETSPTASLYTLEHEVMEYNINKRESTGYQFYPGTERADYNYAEERTDMYSNNMIESTAHLIKGSLGAGVLSMHEAYMYGGLWTSLCFNFIIGLLLSHLVIMLIDSAHQMYGRLRINKLSYPDLAEAAAATAPWFWVRKCSKAFRYTVDTCLFLEMCGTCCIYQIMIARTLKQAFEGIHSPATENLVNIRLYLLISMPGLLLLVLIRSLKYLSPFAILADIFVALCVMASLYYSLRSIKVSVFDQPAWKSLHGLERFCGICMYCTSGICVALPVENNMRRPQYFRSSLQIAMIVVTLLASITGFFGYWGWGEDCQSPITVHMPLNTYTSILQFLLVMMLSTSFAVNFWVPFTIVWHYIQKYNEYKRKSAIWERIYRLVLVSILLGVSMAFPNLISVVIFLGQFFLGFVAIVFPAFIEILIFWETDSRKRFRWPVFKNFMLIILGLFLSASSFYSIREWN